MRYGLTESQWQQLNELLITPLKKYNAQIWVFGSRARGDYHKFSDIDILFSLPEGIHLPPGYVSKIKDSLEESDLPYKVDIVNDKELAASYRDDVYKERIEII